MKQNKVLSTLINSILGGIAISIATYGFVSLGGSIIGTLLFGFGLITIIFYQWNLFTGSAGIVTKKTFLYLLLILIGNVIGCALSSYALGLCATNNHNIFIGNALMVRQINDWANCLQAFVKSIFCGIIMTVAVRFARIGKTAGLQYFLPLLLGVPIFIVSGFFHSIVDAFYVSYGLINEIVPIGQYINILTCWGVVAFGNLIGCNIPRLTYLISEE